MPRVPLNMLMAAGFSLLGCDSIRDASASDVVLGELEGSYELIELEVQSPVGPIIGTRDGTTARVDGLLEVFDGEVRREHSWVVNNERGLDSTISWGFAIATGEDEIAFRSVTGRVTRFFRFAFLDADTLELRTTPSDSCASSNAPEKRWRFRRLNRPPRAGSIAATLQESSRRTFAFWGGAAQRDFENHSLVGASDGLLRASLSLVYSPDRLNSGPVDARPESNSNGGPILHRDLIPTELPELAPGVFVIFGFLDANNVPQFAFSETGTIEVQHRSEAGLFVQAYGLRFSTGGRFDGRLQTLSASFLVGSPFPEQESEPAACADPVSAPDDTIEGNVFGRRFRDPEVTFHDEGAGQRILLRDAGTICGAPQNFVGSRSIELRVPADSGPGTFEIGTEADGAFHGMLGSGIRGERAIEFGFVQLDAVSDGTRRGSVSLRAGNEWTEGTFIAMACNE